MVLVATNARVLEGVGEKPSDAGTALLVAVTCTAVGAIGWQPPTANTIANSHHRTEDLTLLCASRQQIVDTFPSAHR